jgi:hypothetical protein
MNVRTGLGGACLAAIGAALMIYAYQYSMTQAVRTVIASQPSMPALAPSPRLEFSGCGVSSGLYGAPSYGQPGYSSSSGCSFDTRPLPARTAPVAQMTKDESVSASPWLVLAALALPLGLGGAMAAVFWIVRDR